MKANASVDQLQRTWIYSLFLDNFGKKIQKAYKDKSSNEKSF